MTKSDENDNKLLILIKNGSVDATNQLIECYRPTVEVISMKYINSPLEKDDLIQEGMIGLFAAIKSYNSNKGAKFSTYAIRCIENSIKSALTKFSRLKNIPQSSFVELDDETMLTLTALSAEDEYLANESVNTLSDMIYENLSSFENEVLRLSLFGCSYKEIGDKLGKNPKAIDNAIQRIRKKLNGVTF